MVAAPFFADTEFRATGGRLPFKSRSYRHGWWMCRALWKRRWRRVRPAYPRPRIWVPTIWSALQCRTRADLLFERRSIPLIEEVQTVSRAVRRRNCDVCPANSACTSATVSCTDTSGKSRWN